jgi:hypothetical protein
MSGLMGGSRGRFQSIMVKVDESSLWKNMVGRMGGVLRKKVYLVKQRERMSQLGSCRPPRINVFTCNKIHQNRNL